jgi:CDP-paratose 2-epimerase
MKKKVLITGGAGFIGVNSALRMAEENWDVTIFDNLSRKGAEINLEWLTSNDKKYHFIKGDVRNENDVGLCFQNNKYDLILHLAGQVAVTASVENPREDFEVNSLGTFNLLEKVRIYNPTAFFIYSSTNKVYGGMEGFSIIEKNGRYEYSNMPYGISEQVPIDFHSPYGCSKGSADQYVRDFKRIYGLQTLVFRQSCIYGKRQFGIEDQGWVAWFAIAASLNKTITVYGDGKQSRDVLYVDDLVEAYLMAFESRQKIAGNIYNIGGGPKNILSLLELLDLLSKLRGNKVPRSFGDWRPGDQKTFVSDVRSAYDDFGWSPQHSIQDGVSELYTWVNKNLELFARQIS